MRSILFRSYWLLCALLYVTIAHGQADAAYSKQHIEVSLRMIGHQLLLDAGDSTSRVLPIEKENHQYRLKFESVFPINPDKFVHTINRVMKDTKLAGGFYVEVQDCATGDVVYSYKMGFIENSDITPCAARDLPESCYSLLFTLLQEEELESDLLNINPGLVDNTNDSNGWFKKLVLPGIAVLALGVFSLLWWRRRSPSKNPHIIRLGDYQFDTANYSLANDEEKIVLTSKESDLLLLLYNSINSTVTREIILSKVWGDEGDYVGRTLDVFISKLRKKLEGEPRAKIINIRGVGYKLAMEA